MSDHDHDCTCDVPGQLHHWQAIAQQLPLPQLQEMYDDAFTGLADSLNAFNQVHEADSPDPATLHDLVDEVLGRGIVAAIFALGMHMRLCQEVALN
jgi:hypothetical protein